MFSQSAIYGGQAVQFIQGGGPNGQWVQLVPVAQPGGVPGQQVVYAMPTQGTPGQMLSYPPSQQQGTSKNDACEKCYRHKSL